MYTTKHIIGALPVNQNFCSTIQLYTVALIVLQNKDNPVYPPTPNFVKFGVGVYYTKSMFETFLQFLHPFAQKITLGLVTVLAFLNISTGPDVISNTPQPTLSIIEEVTAETTEISEEKKPSDTQEAQKKEISLNTSKEETITPPIETLPVVKTETIVLPLPVTVPTPLIPQAELNVKARKSIVNVFYLTKTSGVFAPITGSGIIIDEKGVVLTNAHVAQYLLLKDYAVKDFINCVIRGGSPADPLYKAEILYLPPVWIEANASNVKVDKPTGTGENDYALLLITESVEQGKPLPASFPAMPFDIESLNNRIDDSVLVAGYPAGFLGGFDASRNLWLTSSIVQIMKLYTFRETPPLTRDAFSVGGTILAQEGASGGGVFSLKTGKLIGVISTSVLEGNTSERDLRAISIEHINRSIQQETGENLETFLRGSLIERKNLYNAVIAPQLTKILTDVLNKE